MARQKNELHNTVGHFAELSARHTLPLYKIALIVNVLFMCVSQPSTVEPQVDQLWLLVLTPGKGTNVGWLRPVMLALTPEETSSNQNPTAGCSVAHTSADVWLLCEFTMFWIGL